jgi:hypothetical protein
MIPNPLRFIKPSLVPQKINMAPSGRTEHHDSALSKTAVISSEWKGGFQKHSSIHDKY